MLAVVESAADGRGQRAVDRQQAARRAVVQAGGGQAQGLAGTEAAGMVVQGTTEVDAQAQVAGQLAAGVVQAGGLEARLPGAGQDAVAVADSAEDRQAQAGIAAEGAIGVVEAGGVHVQAVARHQSLDVAQRLVDAQKQGLLTDDLAPAVVQALRGQGEAQVTGDFAVAVRHVLEVFQRQETAGVDQAVLVVE